MRSVRLRLLVLALLPLIVLLPILLGISMWRWIAQFDDLLIAKVASDLRIAEQYFQAIEGDHAAEVQALAQSAAFVVERTKGQESLRSKIELDRQRLGLDFLLYASPNSEDLPEALTTVVQGLGPNKPIAGLAVLDQRELSLLSSDLAARASIPLVPTRAARPNNDAQETRGMVILVASQVPDSRMVLIGGRLLNRNLAIIDTMNALIYRDSSGGEARTGTTTLFLDDVRISTNVRLFEGERALGTRVSEVVFRQVMEDGKPWLDRAFVVNDWYVSGYVPLKDINGQRIGMLYTGFLETPFSSQRNAIILSLALSFLLVLAVSAPLFLRMAQGIFSPLEKMTATMAQVEAGRLDARNNLSVVNDEIGAVAQHLDRLLDQIQERDAKLTAAADNLNDLVEKRTSELREANKKLEATFAQLVMSEKLASVGEITAGVAHEINNPVAVIQGNLEVLRHSLTADLHEELKTEIDLIDMQTQRINLIVSKLLNFTRPGEVSDALSSVDVAQVVQDTLVLVAADLRQHVIETHVEHHDAPPILAVETELQQVLVNLIINAAQAMDQGGQLTIKTDGEDHDGRPGAQISIADTGPGIPRDRIDHVFDPFFTTKPAEGSGLGLSISQALIHRFGGIITVRSEKGRGTTFFIWCPARDNLSKEAAQ